MTAWREVQIARLAPIALTFAPFRSAQLAIFCSAWTRSSPRWPLRHPRKGVRGKGEVACAQSRACACPVPNSHVRLLHFSRPERVRYTHPVQKARAIRPASWIATSFLFGLPALTFAFLFHWLGPNLLQGGTSWWRIFHLLLILPFTLMFTAALIGAAVDQQSLSWKGITQRLRLSAPSATTWLWAAALSGFMYGGNWADLIAVAASWLALWREKTGQRWMFGAILIGIVVKRYARLLQPILQSMRVFDPSAFHREFFNHFGPKDFMGIPLQGAWWIVIYYAVLILVCNIGGEELWWRGYVLPRQELAFGKTAWVVHGISWSVFHLFMQPTLWDTLRMAITGMALSFVAHIQEARGRA